MLEEDVAGHVTDTDVPEGLGVIHRAVDSETLGDLLGALGVGFESSSRFKRVRNIP